MKSKSNLVCLLVVALAGCGETWEGFVYPDKIDLTQHLNIGTYKSLEECRASALAELREVSSVEAGDYECGLNCEADGGQKVCVETLR